MYAFERFEVRNFTETDGIELMKTVQLDNRHLPVNRQGEFVELGYGVRFFRLNDEFTFDGDGGILGRTYALTGAENQIVGPQIRGRWSTSEEVAGTLGSMVGSCLGTTSKTKRRMVLLARTCNQER